MKIGLTDYIPSKYFLATKHNAKKIKNNKIEQIRNKNTFAFDYYKEIISNYREIADERDMSLLADYLESFANGKNIFEIIHREVF